MDIDDIAKRDFDIVRDGSVEELKLATTGIFAFGVDQRIWYYDLQS